jgi:hypothetical protein
MDILNAVFQLSGTVAQHNSELSMRLTDMERRLSEKRR